MHSLRLVHSKIPTLGACWLGGLQSVDAAQLDRVVSDWLPGRIPHVRWGGWAVD
jgi:hypothetical protein